jgi:hypothetical protein
MNNDKKQTAFEWYMEKHNILVQVCDNMPFDERFKRFSRLVDEAKEMEKEQIIDAHLKGQEDEKDYCNMGDKSMVRHRGNSIEYYEQIYGGNK